MSPPGNEISDTHFDISARTLSASDQLKGLELDKPDARTFDLGSPVSTLRPNRAASSSALFTNTSSSSSSSGSVSGNGKRASNSLLKASESHSGELSMSINSSTGGGENGASGGSKLARPDHRRPESGPLVYSGGGGSSANSPANNVLPLGNICPSGKMGKSALMQRSAVRRDVLGTGMVNYGHGSIVRGAGKSQGDASPDTTRRAMASSDIEEVKRVGNELYKKGQFGEALKLYDRAIAMCPDNAACRSNRAATLVAMGRLGEAVREYEAAVRMDPGYGRARQRLVSLYLRLGHVEDARKHLYRTGEVTDPMESHKLHTIERRLLECSDARKVGDWNGLLKKSEAALGAGADSSIQLITSRAEALLHLHRLEDADCAMSSAVRLEMLVPSNLLTKFCGMLWTSYLYVVRAQVEMALGRIESAESSVEKARALDSQNREVMLVFNNVKSVMRARARGNELFNSGKFADACLAYGEGLKFDPSNAVLYCNRAACHSKLGQWQMSIEDCNAALKIIPNYTKALLRRSASYEKLERWAEAVRDYEVLRKELPHDTSVAEALFHAQIALKSTRGEEVSNMTFGGEVEEIVGIEQFQAAISLPGVSIVYFMAAQNQQCLQISPFLDKLCHKYPTINFHRVNTIESEAVAKLENVRSLPTFKFYKNSVKIKEMICPSQKVLEYSVRHYAL